jgi:prepilin-type processing-associated H-X9-DG protein
MEQPAGMLPKPRTDGMATASLVLGIIGVGTCLPAIVGLILGIVSLRRIGRSHGRLAGQGLAIAGIAVSGFAVLVSAFVIMMAAIVFPVFGRASGKAKQVSCLANMKQVTLAILIYASDNDDRTPPPDTWTDAIEPYYKSADMLKCPEAWGLDCGYAMNGAITPEVWSALRRPEEAVLLFESDLGWNGHGGEEALPAEPRHAGGDNYGFADGHCRWVRRGVESGFQWIPEVEEEQPPAQENLAFPENSY